MLKDLRHGLRMLWQAKSWSAVVIVSLALGIGANTALFSAVNSMLLRKIPVGDPDSLVRLRWAGPRPMATSLIDYGFSRPEAGQPVRATFSYSMFQQFIADNRTMSDLLAAAPINQVNVVVGDQPDLANAFVATGNFFHMLKVAATLGRPFGPEDDQPAASPVAVISHKYWHARFLGDPAIVGKSIRINNVPITVVGVIGPQFTGIRQPAEEPPDVFLPLVLEARLSEVELPPGAPLRPRLTQPAHWWLLVMGRLKPGVTPAQVQGNLEGVFRHSARTGTSLRVDSGSRGTYDVNTRETRSLIVISVVVVLVLLMVCANVANLLLSRAATRVKEVSVRLSLGATRTRLIRQLLTENVLLASIGGALGLVVGYWGKRLLPGAAGQPTTLSWEVLAFTAGVTFLTAIVFGIAPALRATGINVNQALKDNSRSIAGSRSWLTKSLLVAQVSISLVLLIGAGLFLRTVQNLRSVDVGFNPNSLVLFSISPHLSGYDDKRMLILYRDLLTRLRAIGGVQGVELTQPTLLSDSVTTTSVVAQGRTYKSTPVTDSRDRGQSRYGIHQVIVSAGFFELMQMPMLAGRGFTEQDTESAPKVAVINEAAAREFFPNQNPIGQRLGTSGERSDELEVVGVLGDAKYNSVRDPAPATLYLPYQQRPVEPSLVVRTEGEPMSVVGAIREAVREIDPTLPITDVTTQIEQVEQRFQQEKLFARAYALFGGLALLLASVGLFGLMSYSVSRRTTEIGVRVALGAQRNHVLRLVLGESMLLVSIGIALGLGIAVGAGRLVENLLFEITPTDAFTMGMALTGMLIVAALAGYLPTRRALRVDPMLALREE